MRVVRYRHEAQVRHGRIEGEQVRELTGDPFETVRETGNEVALAAVEVLAPCVPSKVLAVGLNYRSHLGGREAPSEPGIFIKLPTSIIAPEATIVLPADATDVHYEGEVVVVIGRSARRVRRADALDHVFGLTAGNDVSERRWQRDDLQWFRAKGSDTFGPLGPAIATDLDPAAVSLETRVNGEVRQAQSTADLIFPIDEIVSYVSRYVTLLPGDVIFTGTPGSTASLSDGDLVEVAVGGVGTLRNRVTAEPEGSVT